MNQASRADECRQQPGVFAPRIERNRCEGEDDCVAVCPCDVFTMGKLPPELRAELSLLGRIRGFAHRWNQAFATNAEACRACALCVSACPQQAITLERV